MTPRSHDELLAVARRLVGASDVRLLAPTEVAAADDHTIVVRGADGHGLVARFDAPVADRVQQEGVLASLVEIFAGTLRDADVEEPADDPRAALDDLLAGLARRVHAAGAAVIDALSPVVWVAVLADGTRLGAPPPPEEEESPLAPVVDLAAARAARDARERGEAEPAPETPRAELTSLADHRTGRLVVESPAADAPEPTPEILRLEAAIAAIRAEAAFRALPHGGALHAIGETSRVAWSARSFAGVYAVLLAHPERPDDLVLAHLARAIPSIERLVLRMPPIDPPPPRAGAARRPRRR